MRSEDFSSPFASSLSLCERTSTRRFSAKIFARETNSPVEISSSQNATAAANATGQGSLTISGGLAIYPWDGSTKEELIHRADEALLAAKRAGKNCIFLVGQE